MNKLTSRRQRSDTDPTAKVDQDDVPTPPEDVGFFVGIRQRVKQHGGAFPFSIEVTRVLCCVSLLVISTVAFVQYEEEESDGGALLASFKSGHGKHPRGKKHRNGRETQREHFRREEWIEVAMCAFYVRQSRFWYAVAHLYHPLSVRCMPRFLHFSHHGPSDAGQSYDTPLDSSVCNVLYLWI